MTRSGKPSQTVSPAQEPAVEAEMTSPVVEKEMAKASEPAQSPAFVKSTCASPTVNKSAHAESLPPVSADPNPVTTDC